MKELIKDERGAMVGYYTKEGNRASYYSLRKGLIGYYDISKRQYTRIALYGSRLTYPQNNQDYGLVDVLYWEGK